MIGLAILNAMLTSGMPLAATNKKRSSTISTVGNKKAAIVHAQVFYACPILQVPRVLHDHSDIYLPVLSLCAFCACVFDFVIVCALCVVRALPLVRLAVLPEPLP